MDTHFRKFNELFSGNDDSRSHIRADEFDITEFEKIRLQFNLDEWIKFLLLPIGIDLQKLNEEIKANKEKAPLWNRIVLNLIARFLPLVVNNFNFLELGPKGTGKLFLYELFSRNSYMLTSNQVTRAKIFFNNSTKKYGLVERFDNIAFTELENVKIKQNDVIAVIKNYMENGSYYSATKMINSDASFSFIGNIDFNPLNDNKNFGIDIFHPIPEIFDLSFYDRIHLFLPGWEIPRLSGNFMLTKNEKSIEYLSKELHFLLKTPNDKYEIIIDRMLNLDLQSLSFRDQKAIRKSLIGFIKILFPIGEPTPEEFDQLVHYSIEGRRRISEQLFILNPEVFKIGDFAYYNKDGDRITVFCPESER